MLTALLIAFLNAFLHGLVFGENCKALRSDCGSLPLYKRYTIDIF
jgi:hypothetical protein